jgi:hypothetical protein
MRAGRDCRHDYIAEAMIVAIILHDERRAQLAGSLGRKWKLDKYDIAASENHDRLVTGFVVLVQFRIIPDSRQRRVLRWICFADIKVLFQGVKDLGLQHDRLLSRGGVEQEDRIPGGSIQCVE